MIRFKLYTRTSILICSLFLTGLCGALMLAYNLRSVGKRKIVVPLVILTIVADAIMFQVMKKVTSDSALRLFVPNIIASIILSYPVWDAWLSFETDEFEEKPVWIPVIVGAIIYGGLIAANYLNPL